MRRFKWIPQYLFKQRARQRLFNWIPENVVWKARRHAVLLIIWVACWRAVSIDSLYMFWIPRRRAISIVFFCNRCFFARRTCRFSIEFFNTSEFLNTYLKKRVVAPFSINCLMRLWIARRRTVSIEFLRNAASLETFRRADAIASLNSASTRCFNWFSSTRRFAIEFLNASLNSASTRRFNWIPQYLNPMRADAPFQLYSFIWRGDAPFQLNACKIILNSASTRRFRWIPEDFFKQRARQRALSIEFLNALFEKRVDARFQLHSF